MGYNAGIGLLSVGGVRVPDKFMKAETYIVTRSVTDLDSYRDANGVLHRNALSHELYKVEFSTPPLLTGDQLEELYSIFRSAYTVASERKLVMKAFIPEINDYVTCDAYMPDANITIYGTYDNILRYNAIRFAFISY